MATRPSRAERIVAAHRRRLATLEARASLLLTRRYADAIASVTDRLDSLVAKMERELARTGTLKPVWLYQEARLNELLVLVETQIQRYAASAEGPLTRLQAEAVRRAVADMRVSITQVLGAAPSVTAEAILKANMVGLNVEAVERLSAAADSGLLKRTKTLGQLAPRVAEQVESALVTGVIEGRHPREIVQAARRAASAPVRGPLPTLVRTELLRSYRGASSDAMLLVPDVVDGWIWMAAGSSRTCAACWAMHGSEHSPDERFESHPNCRCSAIPSTVSWSKLLGRSGRGVPDTRPVVRSGSDLFDEEPRSVKLAVLGPRALEAFDAGQVELRDFVQRTSHPLWGPGRVASSLSAAKRRARSRSRR